MLLSLSKIKPNLKFKNYHSFFLSRIGHMFSYPNHIQNLSKIFFRINLLLIGIVFLNSCESQSEIANKSFLKQYGGAVNEINKRRDDSQQVQSNQNCQTSPAGCSSDKNKWKDPSTIFGIDNVNKTQSASIDTSRIVMPKPPEEFLPDTQTLLQGQTSQLPENMFQISYNLYNFPESYGRSRISFDDINIPKHDAFGVKTELGEKNYQLVGNKTLQRDIDFSKQLISQDDREVSLELIKQEKQIRRKGNSKISAKEPERKEEEIKTNPDKMTKVEIKSDKILDQTPDKALSNIVGKVTDQINKTIAGASSGAAN